MEFEKAKIGSGFKMEGYYIWCGSVIKEEGKYYLFAARWPKEKTFPMGYLTDSEIVLASTESLDKPFIFEKVLISKREGDYWDSVMAHNPFIIKEDGKYIMFYIGSPDGGCELRKIGYAIADSIFGEWKRSDKPLDLPTNANNPAVLKGKDGKYLLYFRDGKLKVSVAKADNISGPYEVLKYDLFKYPIEDMFVFLEDGKYTMVTEDAVGGYTGLEKGGVCFWSEDGINWNDEKFESAYGFDIEYDDGSKLVLQRRERPFMLFDGKDRYLFTTAKINGETQITGGDTWNMVQKIK